MEDSKQVIRWVSVPAFGDWDTKDGDLPDYSSDFSKIREFRKQTKGNVTRLSVGQEDELLPGRPHHRGDVDRRDIRRRTVAMKIKRIGLFNCCRGD